MDCAAFFGMVDDRVEPLRDASRTRAGRQCAVDFLHPRTEARLSDGAAAAFYRSGMVWHERARTIKVELRIPGEHDDRVMAALSSLEVPRVTRSAHRPAPTAGGAVVALVHYGVRCDGATEAELGAVLDAVDEVLGI